MSETNQSEGQVIEIVPPVVQTARDGKGIMIPRDRSTRQPVLAYCRNPECRENGNEFEFLTENDRFCCPKCGADEPRFVGIKTLIHFLIPDRDGPISGSGSNYFIACDTRRAYMATFTNLEQCTGDPACANCPDCLAEAVRRKINIPQGEWIFAKQA